jgi:excisionase family DNA binding protein
VCLETPKQLAARVGLKERAIRSLIDAGKLEYVKIGCRVHIREGAFEAFLEANTVKPCQDETRVQNSIGVPSVNASSSRGQTRAVAAASSRLAQQAAKKLKQSLANGFNSGASQTAQLVHLKS